MAFRHGSRSAHGREWPQAFFSWNRPVMTAFGYNEYKFHVANESLAYVRGVLDSLYGGTDPFPEGVVDSIYFDSMDGAAFRQCEQGEAVKRKFRIRGYGDAAFHQLHLKQKDLFGVSKLKTRIQPVMAGDAFGPNWDAMLPLAAGDPVFQRILMEAEVHGPLVPAIRVRYYRYRYRVNDYRITLDTKIEVMSFANGRACVRDYAVLRDHVLEVKTPDPRPHLPLMGLARLPQISFSKFYLGLLQLEQLSA
jgi:hypothetical protein